MVHGDAPVAQSIKRLTLEFGSGHDLIVRFLSLSPSSGSVLMQNPLRIFSPSLCPSPTYGSSLSQNKSTLRKKHGIRYAGRKYSKNGGCLRKNYKGRDIEKGGKAGQCGTEGPEVGR